MCNDSQEQKLVIPENSFYLASDNSIRRLKGLLQGFLMENDQEGVPAILIKLEASITASIISGCSMDVVIRNPNIEQRSVTLYINDSDTTCYYTLGTHLSEPDAENPDFDAVVVRFAAKEKVWVVLYNELTMPVFHTLLPTNGDLFSFEQWLEQVYTNNDYKNLPRSDTGYYYPETIYTGFPIRINNFNHTHTAKTTVISYASDFRNPELDGEAYNFNDYVGDGKHGYNQELSIKYFLSRFFELSQDVYVSPQNIDGTEFTDFVILLEDTTLLIESKYVLSEKRTKLSNALNKAIAQLNRAENLISSGSISLADKELEQEIRKRALCLRLCLYNDRVELTERNCSNIIKKSAKVQLPIFMSVSTFYQMIGLLQLLDKEAFTVNLAYNLARFYDDYLSGEAKMLIIRNIR